MYCTSLTSIKIPESVTTIVNTAFYASGLTSITIPEGVTSVGAQAFKDCEALKVITFKSATTTIFDGESGENTIPTGTKIIGYASSTAEAYATKYGRTFEAIGTPTQGQRHDNDSNNHHNHHNDNHHNNFDND